VGRPLLVAVWAGLGAVLAALLSVVSGLAVGAVPRSWQWAHDWELLSGITAGLVLAVVAVAVVQARSPGPGEQPGGPAVRVRKIRARTVIITSTAEDVPGLRKQPEPTAGWPLDEVTDPFALEVHRPVQPEDPQSRLPELTAYVPREHDTELGSVVRAVAGGSSGIAVLVGGSSTGKTRACWEALQSLRDRPEQWRLWHPIDPSRPDAALRELPAIGPRTVVWLNEAQFYLDVADGGLGEKVAAGLREMLRDPARAPVLVLATLWPEFWGSLTARHPESGDDPHGQARELLAGHDITVPSAFTAAQLQQLSQVGDTRLVQAAAGARDGQVIQFLAGAPELLALYRNAPPAAAALIRAAMDARRLGMRIGIPEVFLEAAAPGYMTDTEWEAIGEDWLKSALAYTAAWCKGVRGPLTPSRPRPARSRASGSVYLDRDEQPTGSPGGPLYRLADYLDQYGRRHRGALIPPMAFWGAAASFADPGDQATLADAAYTRGLYRDAAQLYKNAIARGSLRAVSYLIDTPHYLRADVSPALWVATHVLLDDPAAVARVLDNLRMAGAEEQATVLLRRDPAARVSLDDPDAVAGLLYSLRAAGAEEQATALADRAAAHIRLDDPRTVVDLLYSLRAAGAEELATALLRRDPATHVSLDDPGAVAEFLKSLRAAGAEEQVTALLRRDPAARVSLDRPWAVADLLDSLRAAGAEEQASALLRRDPAAHISLDSTRAVARLLDSLRVAGAEEQATALADRAAAHIRLDSLGDLSELLGSLRAAGAEEQATALADRAAAHIRLDDPRAVADLLSRLRAGGAREQATALLRRDPAALVSLDNPDAVASLLGRLRVADNEDQVTVLAARAATQSPLAEPWAVANLLDSLQAVGAEEQVAALADRAAAHIPLDDPVAVAWLLGRLRAVGAEEQVAALADRAAAHIPLDDSYAVPRLLERLRAVGAEEQVTVLADRAAAHIPLDDPHAVAGLLDSLGALGAEEQATALLRRDPAAHVSLRDPVAVARLLSRLRAAGAEEQATALLRRDPAAHVSLRDPRAVARLLSRLRAAGAEEQVTALADRAAAYIPLIDRPAVATLLASMRAAGADEETAVLADRLPGAGMFELFCTQEGHQNRFRYGREADGSPAEPWSWEDLD
jgi:hypothetical protein